jgi:NAD(P)H-flavin reductase
VETPDTVTLGLLPLDEPITEPEPGQFAMLYAFAGGEAAISVSGCPRDVGRLRHTIRAVGWGTRGLCGLEPGATVGVRGPFGVGWPLAAAAGRDVLVIAGGIGLAPLRPAVHRLLRERDHYDRVAVLVGARTPDTVLYREELERWRDRDIIVAICVDTAERGWHGDVGVVSDLVGKVPFEPGRAVALVCGPEVMMSVVARQLVDGGVGPERVFVSLERNMQCGIGRCGHCQLGPMFMCVDGPVLSWEAAAPLLAVAQW